MFCSSMEVEVPGLEVAPGEYLLALKEGHKS